MPGRGMGHSERGRSSARTRWGSKPLDLSQVAGRASSEEPEDQGVARDASQTRSVSRGRACRASTPSWWGGYDTASDAEDDVGRSRSTTPTQRRRRQAELRRYQIFLPSTPPPIRPRVRTGVLTSCQRRQTISSKFRHEFDQRNVARAIGVSRPNGGQPHASEERVFRLPARLVNPRTSTSCMHRYTDSRRAHKISLPARDANMKYDGVENRDSDAAPVVQPETPRSARKMGTAHKNAGSWCIGEQKRASKPEIRRRTLCVR